MYEDAHDNNTSPSTVQGLKVHDLNDVQLFITANITAISKSLLKKSRLWKKTQSLSLPLLSGVT